MRKQLTTDTLTGFKDRFPVFKGGASDNLVHSIIYRVLGRPVIPEMMEITLIVWDREAEQEVNLVLYVEGIESAVMARVPNYSMAVMVEASLHIQDSRIYLALHSLADYIFPRDHYNYQIYNDGGPHFSVIGEHCFWNVGPLDDPRLGAQHSANTED